TSEIAAVTTAPPIVRTLTTAKQLELACKSFMLALARSMVLLTRSVLNRQLRMSYSVPCGTVVE
ncbi:hypothetical protein PENTCL1PPCAC_7523, partial [Pristionchus entomophagus]